jgi:hypothetical protein
VLYLVSLRSQKDSLSCTEISALRMPEFASRIPRQLGRRDLLRKTRHHPVTALVGCPRLIGAGDSVCFSDSSLALESQIHNFR